MPKKTLTVTTFSALFAYKDIMREIMTYLPCSLYALSQTCHELRAFVNEDSRIEPLWRARFFAETFGEKSFESDQSARPQYLRHLKNAYDYQGSQKTHAYLIACVYGDLVSLKRMLSQTPSDINRTFYNDCGGDPDKKEATLLTLSIASRQLAIVRYLVEESTISLVGSLYQAAKLGSISMVRKLLNKGVDVNDASATQGTALHAAAQQNDYNMVDFLLANGADVEVTNAEGARPSHLAAWHGSIEALSQLIEAGASLFVFESQGYTPLHCAATMSYFRVVKWLIEQHNVPADQLTERGLTPLEVLADIELPVEADRNAESLRMRCYLAIAPRYIPPVEEQDQLPLPRYFKREADWREDRSTEDDESRFLKRARINTIG